MTTATLIDFETRSRAELDEVGGRRYAEHPSTRAICCCFRWADGSLETWTEHDPAPYNLRQPEALAVVGAHNWLGFDRHIWRMLGWPWPKKEIDTAELARVAGYPSASLNFLSKTILGKGKDKEGNAVTLTLSQPKNFYYGFADMLEQAKLDWRAVHPKGSGARLPSARLASELAAKLDAQWFGKFRPEIASIPDEVLARVVEYCESDRDELAGVFDGALADWLDSDLPGLDAADRALNDRGICFDRELARLLIDASEALGAQALERASELAGRALTSTDVSPQRLAKSLAELGVEIENCQADTLETALKIDGLPELARALIEARQATSSIAAGKLRAGLARVCPDGKLRDNRTKYGAHTGRWAGKGMQLDNLAGGD